jgi:hypothetical protein
MTRTRGALAALLLLLSAACAGNRPTEDGAPQFRDRQLLTQEQLQTAAFSDAYHAVETLRSNWLRPRGVSSPNPSTTDRVWVVLNNTRLGGVETLRQISTREITFIRFYDAASASALWGRDFVHGAIFVSTERR